MKDFKSEKVEAKAFHHVVAAGGHYKPVVSAMKKTKAMTDTLRGKRVLDLVVSRTLLPPQTYMYATTDGTRVRVFFGARRRSTSAMLSIGKPAALLHNLRWAWSTYEAHQHELGIAQVEVCPFDLKAIRLQ